MEQVALAILAVEDDRINSHGKDDAISELAPSFPGQTMGEDSDCSSQNIDEDQDDEYDEVEWPEMIEFDRNKIDPLFTVSDPYFDINSGDHQVDITWPSMPPELKSEHLHQAVNEYRVRANTALNSSAVTRIAIPAAMTIPAALALPKSTNKKVYPNIKNGYACQVKNCFRVFDTKGACTKHEMLHLPHEARPHQCPHCPKRFLWYKDITRHIGRAHAASKASTRDESALSPAKIRPDQVVDDSGPPPSEVTEDEPTYPGPSTGWQDFTAALEDPVADFSDLLRVPSLSDLLRVPPLRYDEISAGPSSSGPWSTNWHSWEPSDSSMATSHSVRTGKSARLSHSGGQSSVTSLSNPQARSSDFSILKYDDTLYPGPFSLPHDDFLPPRNPRSLVTSNQELLIGTQKAIWLDEGRTPSDSDVSALAHLAGVDVVELRARLALRPVDTSPQTLASQRATYGEMASTANEIEAEEPREDPKVIQVTRDVQHFAHGKNISFCGDTARVRQGHVDQLFKCPNCPFSSEKYDGWKRHLQTKYPQNFWHCQVCRQAGLKHFICSRADKLAAHFRDAHDLTGVSASVAREKSRVDYVAYFPRECPYKDALNKMCQQIMDSWDDYLNHLKQHCLDRVPGGPWTLLQRSKFDKFDNLDGDGH
jgi:uncharacterized C2H2 Zn-finger protein